MRKIFLSVVTFASFVFAFHNTGWSGGFEIDNLPIVSGKIGTVRKHGGIDIPSKNSPDAPAAM